MNHNLRAWKHYWRTQKDHFTTGLLITSHGVKKQHVTPKFTLLARELKGWKLVMSNRLVREREKLLRTERIVSDVYHLLKWCIIVSFVERNLLHEKCPEVIINVNILMYSCLFWWKESTFEICLVMVANVNILKYICFSLVQRNLCQELCLEMVNNVDILMYVCLGLVSIFLDLFTDGD